jgi:hypothetical protein
MNIDESARNFIQRPLPAYLLVAPIAFFTGTAQGVQQAGFFITPDAVIGNRALGA